MCIPRPSGGIGRRAALKMRYRKVCGFESHLGHDVFPRQRRFCFDVCTKLAVASSDGLGRGLWPGCRGAYAGVWGAGSSPWLVGLPPAELGLCGSSFRSCRVGPGWPTPIHVPGRRTQHDAADVCGKFLEGFPNHASERALVLALSCQRGCGQCPHLCLLYRGRARRRSSAEVKFRIASGTHGPDAQGSGRSGYGARNDKERSWL